MPTAVSRGSESGANRGGRWVYNGESHATKRERRETGVAWEKSEGPSEIGAYVKFER
jgi:hypothetical protein